MDYKYYCICTLRHGVYVSYKLLGRRLPIEIDGIKGYILLPKFHTDGTSFPSLCIPYDKGTNIGRWGSVSYVQGPDMVKHWHPCIVAVMCVLSEEIDDSRAGIVNQQIENYIDRCVKCIAGLNPDAIDWTYRNEEKFVDPTCVWASCGDEYKWVPTITETVIVRTEYNEVEFSTIKYILENITKTISLPYELLINVKKDILNHQYKEAVLFSAIIIEKTLKDEVVNYLGLHNTEEKITEYISSNIDGFQKIRKAIKKLEIASDNTELHRIGAGTIHIRNRVMHGGYPPSKEEALQAYKDARYIIDYYKVKLFEE